MLEESARAWPGTYETLRTLGKNFEVKDETMATLNCTLAAISLGLQAVKNLYPSEQARRIEQLVFSELNDRWATEELKQYDEAYHRESVSELDPLGAVVGRLLHRWLGENIRNFEAEIKGKKTGFIDAMTMSVAMHALMRVVAAWNCKVIKENTALIDA
jgi:hypothetical protein